MDDRDELNLKFLLSTNDKQLKNWVEHVTNDDIEYALDLLELAKINLIDQEIDIVNDFSIAMSELKKYTL
jgi:hypothetical protein